MGTFAQGVRENSNDESAAPRVWARLVRVCLADGAAFVGVNRTLCEDGACRHLLANHRRSPRRNHEAFKE